MRRVDNLTTFICRLSWNLEPSGPLQACNGIALPFTTSVYSVFLDYSRWRLSARLHDVTYHEMFNVIVTAARITNRRVWCNCYDEFLFFLRSPNFSIDVRNCTTSVVNEQVIIMYFSPSFSSVVPVMTVLWHFSLCSNRVTMPAW